MHTVKTGTKTSAHFFFFFISGVHNKITEIRRAYVLLKFHMALMQP